MNQSSGNYMLGFSLKTADGWGEVMLTPGGRRFSAFGAALNAMEQEPGLAGLRNEIVLNTSMEVVTTGQPDGRHARWLPRAEALV